MSRRRIFLILFVFSIMSLGYHHAWNWRNTYWYKCMGMNCSLWNACHLSLIEWNKDREFAAPIKHINWETVCFIIVNRGYSANHCSTSRGIKAEKGCEEFGRLAEGFCNTQALLWQWMLVQGYLKTLLTYSALTGPWKSISMAEKSI